MLVDLMQQTRSLLKSSKKGANTQGSSAHGKVKERASHLDMVIFIRALVTYARTASTSKVCACKRNLMTLRITCSTHQDQNTAAQ